MPWKFPGSFSSQVAPPGPVDETALHRQSMRGKAGMRFCSIVSIVRSTPRKWHAKDQGLKGVKLHARTGGRPWAGLRTAMDLVCWRTHQASMGEALQTQLQVFNHQVSFRGGGAEDLIQSGPGESPRLAITHRKLLHFFLKY